MKKHGWYKIAVDCLIFLAIYSLLFSYFKPKLLLLDTNISGGDTGSFNYMVEYMKDYLLPNGKIKGWSPGWYAGFPMFQFYFPVPFILASLLGYLIPLTVAFKLVTVLGTFLLPLTAYLAFRLMKFEFPSPIIGALLTLLFLFNQGNSMWGGNIPSTLAGEFSYSLSLAITMLFLGSIYAGVKEKKFLILNSLLLALIGMTHVYTLLFAGLVPLFLLLSRKDVKNNLKYLFKVYFIAGLLLSFWFIPALSTLPYRTALDYVWVIKELKEALPAIILPTAVLSVLGIFIGIVQKEKVVFYFLFILLLPVLLYILAKPLRLVDIRFVPFLQLFIIFPAVYAIQNVVSRTKYRFALPIILFLIVFIWVRANVTYIPFWIEWNYSGFESKQYYQQFNEINNYLKGLPEGRVVHEYSPKHDKFGTPRAFESIPFFADKPVLEGLLIESSISSPFVFWIQSEISEMPTCPIPWMRCSYFSVKNATEHLKMFNVNYVVATSSKLKNALRNNPQYTLLRSFDEIEVYKLNNTGKYVELVKNEPVLIKPNDWINLSLEWFKNVDNLDIPLVFSQGNEDKFKVVIADGDLGKIKRIPIESDCKIEENVKNEEIQIKTSCIGVPLLVKVSYFPNWKVIGADKVYLASPAFILIYPTQENVRLYYSKSLTDIVGEMLSVIGLVVVLSYFLYPGFAKFLNRV